MDWFVYDRNLHHERVNTLLKTCLIKNFVVYFWSYVQIGIKPEVSLKYSVKYFSISIATSYICQNTG